MSFIEGAIISKDAPSPSGRGWRAEGARVRVEVSPNLETLTRPRLLLRLRPIGLALRAAVLSQRERDQR